MIQIAIGLMALLTAALQVLKAALELQKERTISKRQDAKVRKRLRKRA